MFNVPCAICIEMITVESQQKQMGADAGIIFTAIMIDDRRFSCGMSGVFHFKEQLNLKADDEICYNCLKAHESKEELSTKCDLCGKLHQPCFDGDSGTHKSAWGCSASVHSNEEAGRNEIGCGFGSKHDCSLFPLAGTLPVGT